MRILGIETSCDETAASLLEYKNGSFRVLSDIVASQIEVHKKYGGIVPEVAARKQMEAIIPVLNEAMNAENPKYEILHLNNNNSNDKNLKQFEIHGSRLELVDVIAVTQGPGLVTSLRIGVQAAKTLAYVLGKPLIAANHIEGHIYSAFLSEKQKNPNSKFQIPKISFPALTLIVSGGHTELILMKNHGIYEYIGRTRDDAAGEAFDKVAKLLELSYPGGPIISQLAENGDPTAFDFPRPMIDVNNFDFSFSGLKTAVLYTLRDFEKQNLKTISYNLKADLCASFQQAVVDVLVSKTIHAARKYDVKSIILGGGVSANSLLRKRLADECNLQSVTCYLSPLAYTTDNAVMIALAGHFRAQREDFADWKTLVADPHLKLAF